MNLLRIDSSVRIEHSKTRALADYFLHELSTQKEYFLVHRDVGIQPPNFPTDAYIKANYTPEADRTEAMKAVLKPSDIMINELVAADHLVIAAPMYNFSVPSNLKAYIDSIVRVGKTFALDEAEGLKGLLDDKKVVVITSRGGMSYQPGEALHSFDFQENYLRALLNFLGITSITFVHTEAQDFGSSEVQQEHFEHSKQQLAALAASWSA